MNTFEKYNEELSIDTAIDEMNILEQQMKLPAVKHKWVARLIENKNRLNKLNRTRKKNKAAVLANFEINGIPTGIPKGKVDSKIDGTDSMLTIDEQIEDVEAIIQYLEKIEKIFHSMTYDIKNIVEIQKMESM
jgi:hypothetical protein